MFNNFFQLPLTGKKKELVSFLSNTLKHLQAVREFKEFQPIAIKLMKLTIYATVAN